MRKVWTGICGSSSSEIQRVAMSSAVCSRAVESVSKKQEPPEKVLLHSTHLNGALLSVRKPVLLAGILPRVVTVHIVSVGDVRVDKAVLLVDRGLDVLGRRGVVKFRRGGGVDRVLPLERVSHGDHLGRSRTPG